MPNLALVNGMRRHALRTVARVMAGCQPEEVAEILLGLSVDLKNLAAGKLPPQWGQCLDGEVLPQLRTLHPWAVPPEVDPSAHVAG